MGHKPVGLNSSFAITNATNVRGVDKTPQQSDSLRVVAKGAGCHVAIGTFPTASARNYYVHAGESEVISLGSVQTNKVVGVSTTGTDTIIDFAEGTGSPFGAGDAVTLTVIGQSYLNFTHKIVSSVDSSAGVNGFYSTRIVVDHDYGVGYAHTNVIGQAELRGSFMVASFGDGGGTIHYQQVQSSGGAS
tara:strand:- start:441 stop:1007 length:567 start_codon:yes stop_codon:yes gene_type:complete